MFDFLKKKLSESVKKLTKKVEEKPAKEKVAEERPLEKESGKALGPGGLQEKEERFEGKKAVESPEMEETEGGKRAEKEDLEDIEEKIEKQEFEKEGFAKRGEETEKEKGVEEVIEDIEEKIEEKEFEREIEKEEAEFGRLESDIEKIKEGKLKEIERPEEIIEPKKEKGGFFRRITERFVERELTKKDIDDFFREAETDLLEANLAVEVVDFLRYELEKSLAGKPIKRTRAKEHITRVFEESLFKILNQGEIDMDEIIKNKRPACLVFLGFNGSGKTSSIAKVAQYLKNKGYRPLIAAGDTFRAASIEQLEVHGEKLGVSVIKHKYGADSAAVIFDARKHAEAKKYDAVLADTAGRMHTNRNLMDELEKVVRVNRPDLKILVIDSLTGNDAVEQARQFNEKIGVDAVIMTKVDVNKKGGSIFSVCYAIKKPILFLGTGQKYEDLQKFEPREFVKGLLA